DAVHLTLQGDETLRVEDDRNVSRRIGGPVEEQSHLDLGGRVADTNANEKAIELRLREGKGTREILRVLRRDDEEGIRQRDRLTVDRHLAFVHRLEQGGLRTRAGAIDLVGEQ